MNTIKLFIKFIQYSLSDYTLLNDTACMRETIVYSRICDSRYIGWSAAAQMRPDLVKCHLCCYT